MLTNKNEISTKLYTKLLYVCYSVVVKSSLSAPYVRTVYTYTFGNVHMLILNGLNSKTINGQIFYVHKMNLKFKTVLDV